MAEPSILLSHKRSKAINTRFIVCIPNDLHQNNRWFSVIGMSANFVAVVNILMLKCCHIGSGMPFLHICVKKFGQ